jgi:anthranilate phosphoribosyltransferase
MDEISLSAPTYVAELRHGLIAEFTIRPENFGIETQDVKELVVENSQQSLDLIKHAFTTGKGAAADILALNAGAAIFVSGKTKNMCDGVKMAQEVLSSQKALVKLNELINITQGFAHG